MAGASFKWQVVFGDDLEDIIGRFKLEIKPEQHLHFWNLIGEKIKSGTLAAACAKCTDCPIGCLRTHRVFIYFTSAQKIKLELQLKALMPDIKISSEHLKSREIK